MVDANGQCSFELCVLRAFGVSTFHWFLSACNLSLNFFGTDCAQALNFPSCPNVRNTHGSVGNVFSQTKIAISAARAVQRLTTERTKGTVYVSCMRVRHRLGWNRVE
eukprot:COSAG02_NODE_1136_length_14337_cov_50.495505_2_plen_107_part_00